MAPCQPDATGSLGVTRRTTHRGVEAREYQPSYRWTGGGSFGWRLARRGRWPPTVRQAPTCDMRRYQSFGQSSVSR